MSKTCLFKWISHTMRDAICTMNLAAHAAEECEVVCVDVCGFVQTTQMPNLVFSDLFAHSFRFLREHLFIRQH